MFVWFLRTNQHKYVLVFTLILLTMRWWHVFKFLLLYIIDCRRHSWIISPWENQLQATNYNSQITDDKSQIASYRLQVLDYNPHIPSVKIPTTGNELQSTNYSLRIQLPDWSEQHFPSCTHESTINRDLLHTRHVSPILARCLIFYFVSRFENLPSQCQRKNEKKN